MRMILLPVMLVAAMPAAAQVDPATIAQGQVMSATARGYAERDAARLRHGVPRKTAAQVSHAADCSRLWKMRDRMTRSERVRLYDLCPR